MSKVANPARLRWMIVVLAAVWLLHNVGVPPASASPAADKTYDVVVIGSEIQGMLLAKEARAGGLDVLVLDPRPHPGGELIQGKMFFLDDVNDNSKRSLVQGEIRTLMKGFKKGSIRKDADFQNYYNKIAKNLPVKSGITIQSVQQKKQTDGYTVGSLTYRDRSGAVYTVRSRYWVENTDFAALSSKLKVKRIPGMESLNQGKKPDYMAATYMVKVKNVNWKLLHQAILDDYPLTHVRKKYGPNTYVDWHFATGFSNLTNKYQPSSSRLKLRGLNAVDQKDGEVIINGLLVYDVDPSNPASVASAMKTAQAEAPAIVQFLRKNIPGFSKAALNGYPEYLYIRDYNRYETEHVLNYSDVKGERMFWDNVSIGGYSVDLQGTRTIPTGIGYGKPDRYGIPLRSFRLRSYNNVLLAGKNIGADIKAYGSARIMPTTALAAQTMGIILAREQTPLDRLTRADFVRIHRYLKAEYGIDVR
ncbi:FAD-dependent oxidoreductase [Paenibacillus sp. CN-4]|uniref:FAD-dependent oxidoreductase n=1 Tax=Paenibacillus nanchangensis TaxID=3348343 RepID=UPI00397D7FD5